MRRERGWTVTLCHRSKITKVILILLREFIGNFTVIDMSRSFYILFNVVTYERMKLPVALLQVRKTVSYQSFSMLALEPGYICLSFNDYLNRGIFWCCCKRRKEKEGMRRNNYRDARYQLTFSCQLWKCQVGFMVSNKSIYFLRLIKNYSENF